MMKPSPRHTRSQSHLQIGSPRMTRLSSRGSMISSPRRMKKIMEMHFGPTALAGMQPSLPAQPAILEGIQASKRMSADYDAIEEFSGVVQSTKKLQRTFTHIEQLQEMVKSNLRDRRE